MKSGIAIVLAWPEKLCREPGSWYDGLMSALSINRNSYYKVGHAAIVLAEPNNGNLYYFDFGRYHTPKGFGRVRDENTDNDLKIETKARIENNKIVNIYEILSEIHRNPSCHGKGPLYASQCCVNYTDCFSKAKVIQQKEILRYGPFILSGTNCTRFVRTILLAGIIDWKSKIRIRFPFSITPIPINIVNSFSNKIAVGFKL